MQTHKESYSFRLERTSWKSRDLVYEEPGRKLVIYLEMSGVKNFDWVGCDTEFQNWTIPGDEPIPEDKQKEILSRLFDWARNEGLRIDIGPPMDMEEHFEEYERKGWKVERRDDGTTLVSPPRRQSLLSRIIGMFKWDYHDA